jgi:hypothetical protein
MALSSDFSTTAPGLLSEATPTLSCLTDSVDDTIVLYQVRPGTRFHQDAGCTSLRAWQVRPAAVDVSFASIAIDDLCKSCYSLTLLTAIRKWPLCPPAPAGEQMILAGCYVRAMNMNEQLCDLLLRFALALGAQTSQEGSGPLRFVAVVPAELVTWLRRWSPERTLECLSRAEPSDTTAVLGLMVGLWEPGSETMLSDPTTALTAARQIYATQSAG